MEACVSIITCKFGGTSLADADCIRQAEAIVRADDNRRFVVPSAPGKRHPEDHKITDLLYTWHSLQQQGLSSSEPKGIIAARFEELSQELGVEMDMKAELSAIEQEAAQQGTPDFLASRGEFLNGKLIAAYLGATFVDPQHCILFDEAGELNPETYAILGERLKEPGRYVIPGFFGGSPDGKVKTFSRGGSDITGAIVARATHSTLYENWSDISGFRMCDPRIVDDPRYIEEVTYQELRELSYMGAGVLHDEAIRPVREIGIPVNLKNTKEPEHPGTLIVRDRISRHPVCGIAGRAGFSMLNIEKAFMNKERGYGLRILRVLDDFDIAWEHMPTGIDTIGIIIQDDELGKKGPAVVRAIKDRCQPDEVSLASGMAIIATVGKGMNHLVGTAARLCQALADANINLRVIDQGSSEMNIIVGVDEEDLHDAVRAIYKAFADWNN
jgi:aspartate kinase